MKRLIALLAKTVCCATLLAAGTMQAQDTNEIWISARTNALFTGLVWGNGSITNPYYGDFDYIMAHETTNTTIHLLPGVHYTSGNNWSYSNFWVQEGMKIIGAGIDVTTVRWDPAPRGYGSGEELFWSYPDNDATNVEISDMTIDCNGAGNSRAVSAISLPRNDCAVRRVKVINSIGTNGYENFAIFVGEPGTVGGIVDECEVSSILGNYTDGIEIQGQGVVSRNRVFMPPSGGAAIQPSGTSGAIIRDNYLVGGGIYTDTFGETNLTVVGNFFENVENGIFINKGTGEGINGLNVINNIFEMTTNGTPSEWSECVSVGGSYSQGPIYFKNITVSGNTIKMFQDGPKNPASWGTGGIFTSFGMGSNFFNVRVVNNTISRDIWPACALESYGNLIANNTDQSGNPWAITNIASGTGYAMNQSDDTVLVTGTGCTNITLANAWGFAGTKVEIVNNKATGNVVVSAPAAGSGIQPPGWVPSVNPANAILPSGSVTLTPYQSVHLVSDGNTNWITIQ